MAKRNPLEQPDFWTHYTAEELVAQQRIEPIEDIAELKGDFWPEDETEDDFLQFLQEIRGHKKPKAV